MFNPGMFDPAVMSFFKQAGEAFQQTVTAEAQGKMSKALERYCGPQPPQTPADPNFLLRARLYAAKAYAMAHIDGQTTWGGVGELLEGSSTWPPDAALNAQGVLFHAFLLGFLYGSDLPRDRHDAIEQMIPTASRMAASPDAVAQQMGMSTDQLREMTSNPSFQEMAARMMGGQGGQGGGGFDPSRLREMMSDPRMQKMAAQMMGAAGKAGLTPEKIQQMASDPRVQAMLAKMTGGKTPSE